MIKIPETDFADRKTLEKYSSAYTLSDMEIFIFPELFYPLVLANIMSPVIWEWRKDEWFKDIEKKNFTYKANRIKQFIIQNYVFNLDLATWGLTTREREIERFSSFFDIELLKQSNALFGYEGDKYYFDMDIRKHFGLDKFNSNTIPYWKTETVEAMNAFRFKDSFSTGAGECVSLSSLYAAAMFIIGRIPLEKIFLIATPLHSQNFITEKEGLITNNRRIVTKNMWFNGTSLSAKARRALENEKITVVSHITGHIHTIYDEATIDRESYEKFGKKLREFLVTDLNSNILVNFLRFHSKYKTLFQYRCDCSGVSRYIALEKMFEYEHTSKYSVAAETRAQLVREIEGDEFYLSPLKGRMLLNDFETILAGGKEKSLREIESEFEKISGNSDSGVTGEMFREIDAFIRTEPRLPEGNRTYSARNFPSISVDNTRDEIVEIIEGSASVSEMSDLTLYVYRRMDLTNWKPFVKAAIERNPVCFDSLQNKSPGEIYEVLRSLPDESIYGEGRLALPDEVWNFQRGDGIEKALLMAGVLVNRDNKAAIRINIDHHKVYLNCSNTDFIFNSGKNFRKLITINGYDYQIR